MPRELTFTRWKSVTSKQGLPITQTWPQWLELLSKHERRPLKGGPCLTLCLIPPGSPRQNEKVIQVDGICLDIDSGTNDQIAGALYNFDRFEYALHSTHSHGKPRLDAKKNEVLDDDGNTIPQTKIRAVFPLSRTIDPREHKRLWVAFAKMANGLQDEQTKAVSHPFYLPAAPPDAGDPIAFHHSGEWVNPDELMGPISIRAEISNDVPEPVVQEQVAKMQALLRRMPKDHDLKEAANALLKGEAFAAVGERHRTHVKLTGWLAFKSYKAPLAAATIDRLFEKSIDVMLEQDSGTDTIDQVIEGYETALQKATEHKAAVRAHEQKQMQQSAMQDRWTPEDVDTCAELQNCKPDQVAYLIQRNNGYYVLGRSGTFTGPYNEKDMQVELFQRLATSPITLYEQSGEGYRPRSLVELARHHGEVAAKVCADLAAQSSWYDRKQRTLHEVTQPILERTPTFHEFVDKWLRLFCGTEPIYEKILDWLACCPDLNKMLCALTLAGDPGTGKTLFAQGVASLWAPGGATSPVECLLGNFNEDLVRCPVVFADETLPRSWKWDSVTTKLRAEIATLVRTLNRKYYAPIPMHGSLRFLLATNNPMILASNIVTSADLHAIAQRFLYIETKKAAEDFLATLTVDEKNDWRCNKIAEHVLWLQRERAVEPEGRFWVVGDIARMHRLLVTSSDWNSWCCEWIVKGLLDGFRKNATKSETVGRVQIVLGRLYINTNAISEGWATYTNYPNVNPDPRRIATALRSISKSPNTIQLRPTRFRYFEIDLEHIYAWADQQGVSGKEEIEEALAIGIKQVPTLVDLDEKRKEKEKLKT